MNFFVIIPSLNSSKYIEEAIRSIKPGAGNTATVLVVDGCSTDDTLNKILNIQAPNLEIRVISQKDTGPAQAINVGFNAALVSSADVIGWLNSDDLYEPDTIKKVERLFVEKPRLKLVYGLGRHIDECGNLLGPYPTLPPASKLHHFANGSFICQPTVFFRKEVFLDLGLLDETLKTAFDFDFWLRIFTNYPKKYIGFIDANLASSRLHNECITKRFRKLVALESMEVISRYFKFAPVHWVRTYFDEICKSYPFVPDKESLMELVQDTLSRAKSFIEPSELVKLVQLLKDDCRLKFSSESCLIEVQPDGWVSKKLVVRLRSSPQKRQTIKLFCSGSWPIGDKRLHLKIQTSQGEIEKIVLGSQDEFAITLKAPAEVNPSFFYWIIQTNQFFVPKDIIKKSLDTRKLSFKVNNVAITSS